MNRLSVLVVDDEPAARRNLIRLLRELPDIDVAGECGDGASALERIGEGGIDVVFLDIAMPEPSGLEVARRLSGGDAPAVVFVTAFDEHALAAFDAHAIAYLLKPVEASRLSQVVERFRARHHRNAATPSLEELARLLEAAAPDRYATRLAVHADGRTRFLATAEIDWIEADDAGVSVHAGRSRLQLRERLSELESRLSPREFARVHRGALVRIDRIQEIQSWFRGDYILILANGDRVRTGRTYRKTVQRLLSHH